MVGDFEKERHMATNYLTCDEVARRLRRSRWSVYALVKLGRLPAIRVGNRLLFDEQALEQALQQAVCPVRPARTIDAAVG
jgi:excisionase family DNA binding protein